MHKTAIYVIDLDVKQTESIKPDIKSVKINK